MEKLSFKDIILKEDYCSSKESQYSYEEVMTLIEGKKQVQTSVKYPSSLYDYLNEQSEIFSDIVNVLKEKYCLHGFMNKMSVSDIYDIMLENSTVEEIVSDADENENILEDDEFNFYC
jgi:hypothetical protein